MNGKPVTACAPAFSQGRPFWTMPADVKDFLRPPETCYNCGKPGRFALNCIEPKKVSPGDYIQEISNIDGDEDEEETEEEVEETLETKN